MEGAEGDEAWWRIRQHRARRCAFLSSSSHQTDVPVVVVTSLANTLFTPTFAPTFDSTSSTGGVGYYASLQAMHERARHKEWSRRVVRRSGAGNLEPEKEGWWGTMEAANDEEMQHVVTRGKAEGKVVDEVLTENVKMIEELQAWQEVRTRKGDETWIPQREQRVGEEQIRFYI